MHCAVTAQEGAVLGARVSRDAVVPAADGGSAQLKERSGSTFISHWRRGARVLPPLLPRLAIPSVGGKITPEKEYWEALKAVEEQRA
jgi:hypothetical protein